jgi:hypothetical protein
MMEDTCNMRWKSRCSCKCKHWALGSLLKFNRYCCSYWWDDTSMPLNCSLQWAYCSSFRWCTSMEPWCDDRTVLFLRKLFWLLLWLYKEIACLSPMTCSFGNLYANNKYKYSSLLEVCCYFLNTLCNCRFTIISVICIQGRITVCN